MPLDMAVTSDGKTLYVAAFGSSKIGVFNTAALEADTFNPVTDSANYIPVSGGGASGMVLDEARGVLYVMTRFDDAVKTIDLHSNREVARFALPNPEPASVVHGRPMLYDATQFSGNGEAACASCHIFGDKDDLAWDLGNPDSAVTKSPIPINFGNLIGLLVSARRCDRGLDADQRQQQSDRLPSDEGAVHHADAARARTIPARCTGAATAPRASMAPIRSTPTFRS